MNKLYKRLNLASKIAFNVFVVLFGLIMLLSSVAMGDQQIQDLITTQFFGGIKSEIVYTGNEGDVEYYKSRYQSIKQLKAGNNNMTTAAVAEGSVLLKNSTVDGAPALPLAKKSKVTLFGSTSVNPIHGSGGAAATVIEPKDKVLYKQALEAADLAVNPELDAWYVNNKGYQQAKPGNGSFPEIKDASWDEITDPGRNTTEYIDAAIFVISRYGNEGTDLPPTPGNAGGAAERGLRGGNDYLKLTTKEVSVLDGIKAANFDKTILVINSAHPIMDTKIQDADAVLWVGLTGTGGVYGVADIIAGDVTPSGRLSDMWYTDKSYNPTLANSGKFSYAPNNGAIGDNKGNYIVYQEGIYLGYRYAETRYEDKIARPTNVGEFDYNQTVQFPFGYGLSYTNFEYSNFTAVPKPRDPAKPKDSDKYIVSVTVTNRGAMAGKEVVQIYLQQPYTQYDIDNHIEKSAVELVGFAKTRKLLAGASETVSVEVDKKYFASYDAWGIGSYMLDGGDYYITAAKNAHDATNNILAKKGFTTTSGMDANGNANMVAKFVEAEDKTGYKNISTSGQEIVNLFDHADPNRFYDGGAETNKVPYMTRDNWKDTVNFGYNGDSNIAGAKHHTMLSTPKVAGTAGYTDERGLPYGNVLSDGKLVPKSPGVAYPKYGQESALNLIDLRKDKATDILRKYDDPLWDELLDKLTREDTETLLSNGLRKTMPLVSISKPATVDHNGSLGFGLPFNGDARPGTYPPAEGARDTKGLAVKLNDPDGAEYPTAYPSAGTVAASFNIKIAEAIGDAIGEDSLWIGHAGIYGLGMNLHRSPYHGRYAEYFSEDAFLSGMMAGHESKAIQSHGCYVYSKHIISCEQDVARDELDTWMTEQTLRQNYLRPFEMAIAIGNAMGVMTANNMIGSTWPGADYNLSTVYLREECGMLGINVSDWYHSEYMSMPWGVLAGSDLPDGSYGWKDKAVYRAKDDPLGGGSGEYGNLAWAMRESCHRILYTVVHSNAMNGMGEGTRVVVYEPVWITAFSIIEPIITWLFVGVTAFMAATYILLLIEQIKKRKTGPNEDTTL